MVNHFLLLGGSILVLAPTVLGDDTTSSFYSPLNDLLTKVPYQPIGGQNFTRCCLQAVSDWSKNEGCQDIIITSSKNPAVIFTSKADLENSQEQFPCGATYTGDNNGAPQVLITYNWCASNCGGWQQSTNAVLTQWLQPFVGFILPAAVFCLNVRPPPPPPPPPFPFPLDRAGGGGGVGL